MSVGILFLKESLSETFQETVTQDITQTYGEDFSEKVKLKCDDQTGGVGLWQWVVQSADGVSQTRSLHTICRYGDNYDSPPKCPWNACDGSDP